MNNAYLELFETTGTANTPRRRIEILQETTRLGRERGLEVEIALDAANVSRRHAEIRRQQDLFVVVDLGSFNGTFLNGRAGMIFVFFVGTIVTLRSQDV